MAAETMHADDRGPQATTGATYIASRSGQEAPGTAVAVPGVPDLYGQAGPPPTNAAAKAAPATTSASLARVRMGCPSFHGSNVGTTTWGRPRAVGRESRYR